MPLLDPVSVWFWIFLQEFLQKWSMINLNAENQILIFIILSCTREALDLWSCSDNSNGTKRRRKEKVLRFFFSDFCRLLDGRVHLLALFVIGMMTFAQFWVQRKYIYFVLVTFAHFFKEGNFCYIFFFITLAHFWMEKVKQIYIQDCWLSHTFGGACHLSPAPVTCHLPSVTCHLSPVTCHMSHVTCHLSPACHLPTKVGRWRGEGGREGDRTIEEDL